MGKLRVLVVFKVICVREGEVERCNLPMLALVPPFFQRSFNHVSGFKSGRQKRLVMLIGAMAVVVDQEGDKAVISGHAGI